MTAVSLPLGQRLLGPGFAIPFIIVIITIIIIIVAIIMIIQMILIRIRIIRIEIIIIILIELIVKARFDPGPALIIHGFVLCAKVFIAGTHYIRVFVV